MDKYLTILAGNPRGGEQTWQTLYDKVLTPLHSDLAILTGEKWLDSQSFLKESKYKWILDEPDNWFHYYENNFTGNWKEYFNLGKNTGLYNSGSIHFAIKDIVLKNYLSVLKNYDYIIYTRFDQFYVDTHPSHQGESIWIPKGEDYFGICDRHAVVPSQYVENFFSICSYIDSKASLKSTDKLLNCEVSYKNFLEYSELIQKVQRYERAQFTASLPDDFTNWRVPEYKIYFYGNLMIKYPDEYINSISNIKNKYGSFKSLLKLDVLYLNFIYLNLRKFLGRLKRFIIF